MQLRYKIATVAQIISNVKNYANSVTQTQYKIVIDRENKNLENEIGL